MDIPFLSDLLSVFQRRLDVGNDVLADRKLKAQLLTDTCAKWAELLHAMLNDAAVTARTRGSNAAAKIIEAQQRDFLKLDYHVIREESPILLYLREDSRFAPVASASSEFYDGAIDLKALNQRYYSERESMPLERAINSWLERLEVLLENVRAENRKVQVIKPR
jgi:hypothetical protein